MLQSQRTLKKLFQIQDLFPSGNHRLAKRAEAQGGGWWLVAGGWWREKTNSSFPATSHQPPATHCPPPGIVASAANLGIIENCHPRTSSCPAQAFGARLKSLRA